MMNLGHNTNVCGCRQMKTNGGQSAGKPSVRGHHEEAAARYPAQNVSTRPENCLESRHECVEKTAGFVGRDNNPFSCSPTFGIDSGLPAKSWTAVLTSSWIPVLPWQPPRVCSGEEPY